MLKQITAYEAYGIFGNYDGNAPDTSTICLVATEQIAKEVCAVLNENPEDHVIVFVDGWEHSKSFAYRRELTDHPNGVCDTTETALAHLTQSEDDNDQ
jgi:hypothetical protein